MYLMLEIYTYVEKKKKCSHRRKNQISITYKIILDSDIELISKYNTNI